MLYVEELIGPDTVNTMPAARQSRRSRITARCAATRSTDDLEAARQLLKESSRRPASTTTTSSSTLEQEGVQKFADSFSELLDGVRAKREAVTA